MYMVSMPRLQCGDTSKRWPLPPSNLGRTISSINDNKKNNKKYNCKRTPFFPFIEMDHVIIDTLHLFLRISDILIDNFIRDLKAKYILEKISFKSGKNVEKFTSYINSLGIPFKLTINPDSKKGCSTEK